MVGAVAPRRQGHSTTALLFGLRAGYPVKFFKGRKPRESDQLHLRQSLKDGFSPHQVARLRARRRVDSRPSSFFPPGSSRREKVDWAPANFGFSSPKPVKLRPFPPFCRQMRLPRSFPRAKNLTRRPATDPVSRAPANGGAHGRPNSRGAVDRLEGRSTDAAIPNGGTDIRGGCDAAGRGRGPDLQSALRGVRAPSRGLKT
jgi:hypothetical protein